MRLLRALGLALACAGPVTTTSAAPVYAELQLGAGAVEHSELDFYPAFGSVTLGAWVRESIGLELFADSGLRDGEESGFELGLADARGVALRLRSPPREGLSGYVVLGYVDFTLEQRPRDAEAVTLDTDLTGARVSVGVSQRLDTLDSLLVSAEYRNYYNDADVRVDGLVLGLRWDLR